MNYACEGQNQCCRDGADRAMCRDGAGDKTNNEMCRDGAKGGSERVCRDGTDDEHRGDDTCAEMAQNEQLPRASKSGLK